MKKIYLMVVAAVAACGLRADVKLAAPVNDGSVLQREKPIVVWQIGTKDGTGNEFALAPDKYSDFLQHDFGWENNYFLDAREVLKGGTLELWMGPEPNREWGL